MSRRFSRRHGLWLKTHLADNVAADPPVVVPPSAPPEQVTHPTITPTHPNWYRVMRAVREDGVLAFECIGEFPDMASAFGMAAREAGRSRVTDCHSKVLMDNWRSVETR